MRPWYMPPSNAVPVTIFRVEKEREGVRWSVRLLERASCFTQQNVKKVKKSFRETKQREGERKSAGAKSRIARTFCAV